VADNLPILPENSKFFLIMHKGCVIEFHNPMVPRQKG